MQKAAQVWHEALSGLGMGSKIGRGFDELTRRDIALRNWVPGTPLPN